MHKKNLRKLTPTERKVQVLIDDLVSVQRRLKNLRPIIGQMEADALAQRRQEAHTRLQAIPTSQGAMEVHLA